MSENWRFQWLLSIIKDVCLSFSRWTKLLSHQNFITSRLVFTSQKKSRRHGQFEKVEKPGITPSIDCFITCQVTAADAVITVISPLQLSSRAHKLPDRFLALFWPVIANINSRKTCLRDDSFDGGNLWCNYDICNMFTRILMCLKFDLLNLFNELSAKLIKMPSSLWI